MRSDACERVSFQPLAGVEQPWRDLSCCGVGGARRKTGLRLLWEIEAVGDETQRHLTLRRLLEASQHLASTHERFLAVGCTLDLQPHAVQEITRRSRDALLETVCQIGGIEPAGKGNDTNVESLCRRKLHPTQRRRLAGCVAVEAQDDLLRQAR